MTRALNEGLGDHDAGDSSLWLEFLLRWLPPAWIGFVGCGQLEREVAVACHALIKRPAVYMPERGECAECTECTACPELLDGVENPRQRISCSALAYAIFASAKTESPHEAHDSLGLRRDNGVVASTKHLIMDKGTYR